MQWICLLILTFNLPQTWAPCHTHTEARPRSQLQVGSGWGLERGSGLSSSSMHWMLPGAVGPWPGRAVGNLRLALFLCCWDRGWGLQGGWNGLLAPEQGWGSPRKCWAGMAGLVVPWQSPPWGSRDCKRLSKLPVQQLSRSRQQGALSTKLNAGVWFQPSVDRSRFQL